MKTTGMMTAVALIGVLGLLSAGGVLAHGPGMSGDRDDMPMMGRGMMGQGYQGQGYQGQMPMMGYGMMGPGMGMGPGMMMGPGMGYGYGGQMPMMGYGMMGSGMMMGPGYGMMGGCGDAQTLDRDIKADDVKKMMEQRVAWARNPNLKVGKVTEKDGDTIEAEVVTKDNSLVRKFSVDRHTGRMQPVQ